MLKRLPSPSVIRPPALWPSRSRPWAMTVFWIVMLSITWPLSGFIENVSSTPHVTDMWSKIMFEPRDRLTESSRVPASPLRTAM